MLSPFAASGGADGGKITMVHDDTTPSTDIHAPTTAAIVAAAARADQWWAGLSLREAAEAHARALHPAGRPPMARVPQRDEVLDWLGPVEGFEDRAQRMAIATAIVATGSDDEDVWSEVMESMTGDTGPTRP